MRISVNINITRNMTWKAFVRATRPSFLRASPEPNKYMEDFPEVAREQPKTPI